MQGQVPHYAPFQPNFTHNSQANSPQKTRFLQKTYSQLRPVFSPVRQDTFLTLTGTGSPRVQLVVSFLRKRPGGAPLQRLKATEKE